jgi:uncharacterized protein YecE (DUF72 family)
MDVCDTPTLAFGISGWSYPDWDGWVYPPRCGDKPAYVAPFVDFIEINSTFYAVPAAHQTADWVRRTAHLPRFFFTAKLHRAFTHDGAFGPPEIAAFREAMRPLSEAGRLATCLAQFPASFDNRSEHAARLARLAEAFADVPLTVELRHRSWEAPEALAFCGRLGVSVANLDYPAGDQGFGLQQCRVGDLRYLRLHGRNAAWNDPQAGRDQVYDYLYSPAELDALAKRVTRLADGARRVLVAANNHYQGKEVVTAVELKAAVLRQPVPAPPLLRQRYPRLAT